MVSCLRFYTWGLPARRKPIGTVCSMKTLGDRHTSGLIREKTRIESRFGLLRLLSGPEVSDGNTVQVIRKGDNLCADVEDNTSHPFLANRICEGRKPRTSLTLSVAEALTSMPTILPARSST